MKIIINGEYPTMNEIIEASKSHYMAYANQKKEFTQLTMIHVNNIRRLTKLEKVLIFRMNFHFNKKRSL